MAGPTVGGPDDVVPFGAAVRAWFAISLQTSGGPAGQIAVMQRTPVDERRWIGQRRVPHALDYCMLRPARRPTSSPSTSGGRSTGCVVAWSRVCCPAGLPVA